MPISKKAKTPKYRLHKATGQAVVTLAGVDRYLGKHGSAVSKKEYRRLIQEWRSSGCVKVDDSPSISVMEVISLYWKWANGYYRMNGKKTDTVASIKATMRLVKAEYGHSPAVDFGPKALKALQATFVENGWSRRYVNDSIDRVRRMFKWAVSEEILPSSIYEALRTVPSLRRGRTEARDKAPVSAVADEIVEQTLQHLPPIVADLVRFQRYTACRPAEACLVRPGDIEIPDHSPVWYYRPREHKNAFREQERIVVIGPRAQSVIEKYLDRPDDCYCFVPKESEYRRSILRREARKTPMYHSHAKRITKKSLPKWQPGERYTPDSYRRAIVRVCEKHGIPKWTPGQLRHSAATEARRVAGLEAAQTLLGHAFADVTQIYAERNLALAAQVAQVIG